MATLDCVHIRTACSLRRQIRKHLSSIPGVYLTGHELQYLKFDDHRIARFWKLEGANADFKCSVLDPESFGARKRRTAMIEDNSDLDYLVESPHAEQQVVKALKNIAFSPEIAFSGERISVNKTSHFDYLPVSIRKYTGISKSFHLTTLYVMKNNLVEVKVDIVLPFHDVANPLTQTSLFRSNLPYPDILSTLIMTECGGSISFRSAPDMLRILLWNAWPALQKMNDDYVTVTEEVLRRRKEFSSDYIDVLTYFQRIAKTFKQNKTIANISIKYDKVSEKFSILCRSRSSGLETHEWRHFSYDEVVVIVNEQEEYFDGSFNGPNSFLAKGQLQIQKNPPSFAYLYCDPDVEWLESFLERFPQMSSIMASPRA